MTFPTTQWSLFAVAAQDGEEAARHALDELCRRYHAPVLAYFRSHVPVREDAEDLTQELFRQLLVKQIWFRADVSRGRFRYFLMCIAGTALKNWLKARGTQKRGGRELAQSLDLLMNSGHEPAAPDDHAELAFDREWARTVMTAAWQQMANVAARTPRRAARFAVLRRFLPGSEAPPTYAAAAEALSTSADNVKSFIHRLREDFRDTVRRIIADTVLSGEDVPGEMEHLAAVMAAGHVPSDPPGENILSPLGPDRLLKQ